MYITAKASGQIFILHTSPHFPSHLSTTLSSASLAIVLLEKAPVRPIPRDLPSSLSAPICDGGRADPDNLLKCDVADGGGDDAPEFLLLKFDTMLLTLPPPPCTLGVRVNRGPRTRPCPCPCPEPARVSEARPVWTGWSSLAAGLGLRDVIEAAGLPGRTTDWRRRSLAPAFWGVGGVTPTTAGEAGDMLRCSSAVDSDGGGGEARGD